jgi:predicted nucleic acid-binding protein
MIAIDTNVVSGILKGSITKLPMEPLYVPFVVQAELYYGVAVGSNPDKYRPVIDKLLVSEQIVLSIAMGSDVIQKYVSIGAQLKKSGTPISPNDLWIAAECSALGHSLWTLDKDFKAVEDIKLFESTN